MSVYCLFHVWHAAVTYSLSKYLWQLKDKQEEYSIAWRIVAKAKPYTNNTKRCNLCTAEKHLIITKPFTHEKRKNDTELRKYLWQLKDKQEEYSIAWRIVAKAKPYTNHTKRCNLCLQINI